MIIIIIPLEEQHLLKIPQLPFLLCEVRAAILDFILISWLFFKTIVRNAFLAPKYPRVEVLLMIVDHQGQFLHWGPFSLFAHLHHAHALNMLIKISPKLLKQQLS